MPTLPVERVAASYVYYDAQTDDARLTLAIARTAADYGAAIANYTDARRPREGTRRCSAHRARRAPTDRDRRARPTIVNATGVWSDDVRALDEGTHPSSIRPAKGVHITVPWSLVQNQIAVVDPGTQGPALGVRRSVGRVERRVRVHVHRHDRHRLRRARSTIRRSRPTTSKYLLGAINAVGHDARSPRPTSSARWAGLRPLVRAARSERTADLSRRHSVRTSDSGVITVTGGKLTTYRRMAADAVDEIVEAPRHGGGRSRTKHIRLHGATGWDAPDLPATLAHALRRRRSRRARAGRAEPTLAEPIVPGLDVHPGRGRATRLAARWRAPSTTCCRAAPAPGCSLGMRRPHAPRTSRTSWPPSSDGMRAEQRPPGRALPCARRRRADDGRAARDCARRAAASNVVAPDVDAHGPAPAWRPTGARPHRRSRSGRRRPASPRTCPTARRRGRRARAPSHATRAPTSHAPPAEISEASRDWWPLAMIWALDDQVDARAASWSCARLCRARSPRSCDCATKHGFP